MSTSTLHAQKVAEVVEAPSFFFFFEERELSDAPGDGRTASKEFHHLPTLTPIQPRKRPLYVAIDTIPDILGSIDADTWQVQWKVLGTCISKTLAASILNFAAPQSPNQRPPPRGVRIVQHCPVCGQAFIQRGTPARHRRENTQHTPGPRSNAQGHLRCP